MIHNCSSMGFITRHNRLHEVVVGICMITTVRTRPCAAGAGSADANGFNQKSRFWLAEGLPRRPALDFSL
jgi:hypothetical protein